MNARPRYDCPSGVAIICYLLLGSAAVELTRTIILGFFPRNGVLPLSHYLIGVELSHAVILAVCAYFMLKGKNWARIAFYVVTVANVIDLLVVGFSLEIVVALAKLIIAGGLLATRRANRFFSGKDPNLNYAKPSKIRSVEEMARHSRQSEGRYEY